jgi:hypothetical protein
MISTLPTTKRDDSVNDEAKSISRANGDAIDPANRLAPNGYLWVCHACGKTASDRYGIEHMDGWDESCMLNSALHRIDLLVFGIDRRVTRVKNAVARTEGTRPRATESTAAKVDSGIAAQITKRKGFVKGPFK